MTYQVKIHGLKEALKLFKEAPEIVGDEIVKTMKKVTQRMTSETKRNTPVDTNRLRSSIGPEIEVKGDDIIGRVRSTVDYAIHVEKGTRPHWPPLAALRVWARRHGVNLYYLRRSIGTFGTSKMAKRLYGTKGYEMFKRALDQHIGWVQDQFNDAAKRIMGRLGKV